MLRLRRISMAAALLGGLLAFAAAPAEANVIDRFKDIYNAPEKLEELQQNFAETQAALDKAKQQAEEYAEQQLELIQQNEAYREQNESLMKQNQELMEQMNALQKDQSERKRFYRKIAASVLVFAGMGLLYLLSVRIWRYMVWRKQRALGEGKHE